MATIDEYLAAIRQQKTQPILQAWQKAKDNLANQQTQIEQERDQSLPQYDVRKNQEDQAGWQQEQNLMRRAQASGNTTSGQLDTNLAMIKNSVMNNKFGVDNQKQTFVRDVMNRLNQVKQNMSHNDMDKDSNLASLEGELGSMKAKYIMDQEQAAAKKATTSKLTHQDKYDNTTQAFNEIDQQLANGLSHGDIHRSIQEQWDELVKAGYNPQQMIDYLYKDLETTPDEL